MVDGSLLLVDAMEGPMPQTYFVLKKALKNCACKSIEVKVGPSRHRMAENIRALGLDTAKPFVVMSSDYVQTRLNPGKPVANWKSPALPYQYEQEVEFYRKQKELLGERS